MYDDNLLQLQQKVARKKQLESMVGELRSQHVQLSLNADKLQSVMLDEQEDIEKLEGGSLAAFFYNVIGRLDEKLDEERKQAYAARVKYDAAMVQLGDSERELASCEAELRELANVEVWYQSALLKKKSDMKAAGGPHADEILALEEKVAFLNSQKRELREAISAGNHAYSTAKSVMSSLDEAEGYSTWDMLGGGMIADIAKHSKLDDAQADINRLQSQLRKFKTELADVTVHADLQVNIGGFMQFADFFFDGLFADWAVRDEIHNSQNQVSSTMKQIASVVNKLVDMENATECDLTKCQSKLEELVIKA